VSPRRNARATVAARPAARGKTRALGQHFLRDDRVAQRIVALVAPTARDLVVEIGPGRGALTGHLARAAGRVLALEVDAGLAAALRDRFPPSSSVAIMESDARRFGFSGLRERLPDPGGRVLAVGNLPYSVGKPILMALVEAGRAIDEMALMFQKEVAERVAATPGSKAYGALSVLTQVACEVTLAFTVPPGAFTPPPRVDSAVIHLRVRAAPAVPIADPRRFGMLVRAAFGQRRKNLANALAAGLALPVDDTRVLVTRAGIDPACRAETLALADFARLADILEARRRVDSPVAGGGGGTGD
jgi:16S rRNA (adenine1518-N6/adenine1519-N6)-dimethyltransferase